LGGNAGHNDDDQRRGWRPHDEQSHHAIESPTRRRARGVDEEKEGRPNDGTQRRRVEPGRRVDGEEEGEESTGRRRGGEESMRRWRRVDEEKGRRIEQSRLRLCSFLYILNYIGCI